MCYLLHRVLDLGSQQFSEQLSVYGSYIVIKRRSYHP